MNVNIQNERLKSAYVKWLLRTSSKRPRTADAVLLSLHAWDEFTKSQPYKAFNKRSALEFKDWLITGRERKGKLSDVTIKGHLLLVKKFFTWLSREPGYRSHIKREDLEYLNPDHRIICTRARQSHKQPLSLEYVKEFIASIDPKTERGRRDRALVSFLALTGIRADAAISLPVGAINISEMSVNQDPALGVRTKGGNPIRTGIFEFESLLFQVFNDWYFYLQHTKKFSDADPLFPKTVLRTNQFDYCFTAEAVQPEFWSSAVAIRIMLKKRALQAGLPYYNPHSFRHMFTKKSIEICDTPEECKAISESLGHKRPITTLLCYGTLDPARFEIVIAKLQKKARSRSDRSDNPNKQPNESKFEGK